MSKETFPDRRRHESMETGDLACPRHLRNGPRPRGPASAMLTFYFSNFRADKSGVQPRFWMSRRFIRSRFFRDVDRVPPDLFLNSFARECARSAESICG